MESAKDEQPTTKSRQPGAAGLRHGEIFFFIFVFRDQQRLHILWLYNSLQIPMFSLILGIVWRKTNGFCESLAKFAHFWEIEIHKKSYKMLTNLESSARWFCVSQQFRKMIIFLQKSVKRANFCQHLHKIWRKAEALPGRARGRRQVPEREHQVVAKMDETRLWFEAFRCSASTKSEIRSENFLEKSWRLAVNVLIMTGTSPSKIRKLATPYTFMSYMFGFCIQPVVIRSENKCDHCLWSRSTCPCIIYESPFSY